MSPALQLGGELDAKRVQFLLQTVPTARNVGVLDPGQLFTPRDVRIVAQATGIQLQVTAPGSGREGYEQAFESMADAHVEALLVPAFPRFVKEAPYRPGGEAAPSRPCTNGLHREVGWPMGPTPAEERAASFVGPILKGAKPAELAVEQPTRFKFVINTKTAKARVFMFSTEALANGRNPNPDLPRLRYP